jgi:hypothetical protein
MEFIKILTALVVFGGIFYALYETFTHKDNTSTHP